MSMEFTGVTSAKDGMNDILTELERMCEEAGFIPLALMFCKSQIDPDKTVEMGRWLNQRLEADPEARFHLIADLKLMLEKLDQRTKQ